MSIAASGTSILHAPIVKLSGGTVTLSSLIVAVAIVVLSVVFGRLAGKAVHRLLARRHVDEGPRFAAEKIFRYLVMIIGALVALSSAGIDLNAFFAASAVLLVGLGFGLQNIAQNFVSGVILLIEQPVRKGDFVKVGDVYGEIADIGMRATRVMTRDEVMIIVPNSELITGQVVNNSIPTPDVRISISVGVAYGSDMDLVRRTLLAVAAANPNVLSKPPPEVRFLDFGDSSLNLALLVWIGQPRWDLRTSSELRFAIDAAFRKAKIEMPFPQRVVTMVPNAKAERAAS